MKDAMTGLIRAVVILFAFLLVFNLVKPMIMKSQSSSSLDDVYDDGMGFYDDEDGSSDKKEDTGTSTTTVKYDNNYDYRSLYEQYNYDSILEVFGSEFKKYYYQGKKLDNDYYLYVSIVNLTKNKFVLLCNNQIDISEEKVLEKVKQLFGNVEFTHKSYTSEDKNFIITYDATTKTYKVENMKCSGIRKGNEFIETKLLGGSSKDDELFIYEQAHLVKNVDKKRVLCI